MRSRVSQNHHSATASARVIPNPCLHEQAFGGMELPLVAAADEDVAAELGRCCRLDAEAVRAVDAEEDPVGGRSGAVHRVQCVGDGANRQFHARARVHPGQREGSRPGRDRCAHRRDDLGGRHGVRLPIETDPAHVCARPERTQPQRFVRRIEVVTRCEHLLAGPQVQRRRRGRGPSSCNPSARSRQLVRQGKRRRRISRGPRRRSPRCPDSAWRRCRGQSGSGRSRLVRAWGAVQAGTS